MTDLERNSRFRAPPLPPRERCRDRVRVDPRACGLLWLGTLEIRAWPGKQIHSDKPLRADGAAVERHG